jgi:CheY-like chemotaxis protein
MRPTLLIVDDHSGFRSLARRLLTAGGFEVVGEAADGHAAITATHTLRPDVVLLDIQLPDIDGFEVAAAPRRRGRARRGADLHPGSRRLRPAGGPLRRLRVHPQGGAVRGRDTLTSRSDRMR